MFRFSALCLLKIRSHFIVAPFALAYVTFFGPENLPTLEAFALGCPVVASRCRRRT